MKRFLILMLMLTGCGVRLEVAAPVAPTEPAPQWSSIGYMSDSVTRQMAAPRLTFADTEGVSAQLFMQSGQSEVFLLQNHQLWLTVDYDATWFAANQSSAQVRLNVSIRYGEDEPWADYDNVQATLTATELPTNVHDSVGVGVYVEEQAAFDVRAEVTLTAYLANGDIVTDVDTNEFHVHVFSDMDDIETDPATLAPQWGEPDAAMLLPDWRTWNSGPCGLIEAAQDDSAADGLTAACAALSENDDIYGAIEGLWAALGSTENLELLAPLHAMQGLAHYVVGDFETAANEFTYAAESYRWLDRAWDFSVNLHNATFAHFMRGDDSSAYPFLLALQELRGQFYDEAGVKLTQANFARFSGEAWLIEDTQVYFVENDLPQVQITEQWLRDIDE